MIAADFVLVNARDEWVEKGCRYAEISLTRTYNRMNSPYFDKRLRCIVVGIVAEHAFLDWVKRKGLNYRLDGRTAWYESDRWDISINGVPYDVKALFVDEGVPQNLSEILNWHILVPVDQLKAKISKGQQVVYVFAFVFGRWLNYDIRQNALHSTSDRYRWLIHVPWDFRFTKRDEKSAPLGKLKVSICDPSDEGKEAILIGTRLTAGSKREIIREKIVLSVSPKESSSEFFELLSIRYLDWCLPCGEIRIKAQNVGLEEIPNQYGFISQPKAQRNQPPLLNGWYDIWLHDAKVLLACWVSGSEILDNWDVVHRRSRRYPVKATQTENYCSIVSNVHPLAEIE